MLKHQIEDAIKKSLPKSKKQLGDFGAPKIIIEYPEKGEFGDYSTNMAMQLAKLVKKNPTEIAELIVGELKNKADLKGVFQKIEVVKPGFINFFVSDGYLQRQVGEIVKADKNFGKVNIGEGKKVHIDFISANPTGPLHMGNGRGGFLGDVLGNILKQAGFEVNKEYYINDYGGQIEKLGHSVLKDGQAVYKGEYIDYLHKKIKSKDSKEAGKQAVEIIMNEMIEKTIKDKMKIKFDNWFSERTLHEENKIEDVLQWLQEKKLAYEKDGAVWFKSSEYGDDKDRVFKKSDGAFTYLAGDFAYHKNKLERGFDKLIDIWGADHHGDMARIKAAVEVLGHKDKLDIILYQLVRLIKDGKEVRMSKRAGTYITIDELIDEVGVNAARFFFLMRSPDSHFDFDLELAKEKSDKNPVYYVQYAYARICSIIKKSYLESQISKIDYGLLNHPCELALIREMVKLPELVEEISINYNAQKMPIYSMNLAKNLHSFYKSCKILESSIELREARMQLIIAAKIVLKKTLDLMGIDAPEKM